MMSNYGRLAIPRRLAIPTSGDKLLHDFGFIGIGVSRGRIRIDLTPQRSRTLSGSSAARLEERGCRFLCRWFQLRSRFAW